MGLAVIGKFAWSKVLLYIAAQKIGGLLGTILAWLTYLPHWQETESEASRLAVFSTGPAIRQNPHNLITEIIGTSVLVFGVLTILANAAPGQTGLTQLLIGFLV